MTAQPAAPTVREETVPLEGLSEIGLHIDRGGIEVETADVTEVRIVLTAHDPSGVQAVRDARIEAVGPRLLVDTRYGGAGKSAQTFSEMFSALGRGAGGDWVDRMKTGAAQFVRGNGDARVDVCVQIPAGFRAVLETGRGDVRSRGDLERVESRVGAGSVTIDAVETAKVEIGTGPIRIERGGDLLLRAGTSEVHLGETRGDARIALGSGSTIVDSAREGRVAFKAGSGDLTVGVPEGTAAKVDFVSASGDKDIALTPTDAPGAEVRRVEIDMKAAAGRLRVRRSQA